MHPRQEERNRLEALKYPTRPHAGDLVSLNGSTLEGRVVATYYTTGDGLHIELEHGVHWALYTEVSILSRGFQSESQLIFPSKAEPDEEEEERDPEQVRILEKVKTVLIQNLSEDEIIHLWDTLDGGGDLLTVLNEYVYSIRPDLYESPEDFEKIGSFR